MVEEYVSYDKYCADLADFRADMSRYQAEMAGFREETRQAINDMRVDMVDRFASQTKWMIGLVLTGIVFTVGLTVTLIKLLP